MNTENHENNHSSNNDKNNSFPAGVKSALAIGTLLSVLIAFNQCTLEKKTNSSSSRSTASTGAPESNNSTNAADIESDVDLPPGLDMPPGNTPTPPSELDTLDVGVKDFEQVYRSMAAVTGVDSTNTTLVNLFSQLSSQLPSDNSIKGFLPSNQVAITKLAAEYCELLVENATLRVVIWPNLNFAQTPQQAFNAASKQLIINQTMTRFLPPLNAAMTTSTYNELSKLWDDLLAGDVLTSNVTTRKIVKGMCISTLASAHANLL